MEIINRFFTVPKQSFFLFGPRGTGKSTWIKICFPNAIRLDLLDPEILRRYSAKPERLRELVLGNPNKPHIIIDEIQKAPILLPLVHSLIEQDKKRQFILTGSSARKLKRTGVDLLAGRALNLTLHPFMAAELGKRFSLPQSLELGMIPLVLAAKNPKEVLRTYAALYVQEEVQMEGLVRNIGNFARFLEAISFSHASLLNTANVARECEIERKTVVGYVEILEDLLLGFRLYPFTKRTKRAVTAHPKFYFFDCGVFRSLRPTGPLDRREEIEGHALEGLVAEHLRAWCAYRENAPKLYFWRTRAGVEVDFIVYGEDTFTAIEVKNTNRIHPEDLRGLRNFQEIYPEATPILLYRGDERLRKDKIWCIPIDKFLISLYPNKQIKP